MKRGGYIDYPTLKQGWSRRQCTVAKTLRQRIAVYTKAPKGVCTHLDSDNYAIANPYMFNSSPAIILTGYFPLVFFEEKGALKLKKGYADILTNGDDEAIVKALGSQLEQQFYVEIIDLSSNYIVSSGEVIKWVQHSSQDVQIEFIVRASPMNYHEFLNEIVPNKDTIEVPAYERLSQGFRGG